MLEKKLPMALIHEGIGEVVFDKTSEFKAGDKVVMIPNTPKGRMSAEPTTPTNQDSEEADSTDSL